MFTNAFQELLLSNCTAVSSLFGVGAAVAILNTPFDAFVKERRRGFLPTDWLGLYAVLLLLYVI